MKRVRLWVIWCLLLTLAGISLPVLAADVPVSVKESQSEEYIPATAQKAIGESQRQLVVTIPMLGGGSRTSQGSAFLVSEDGLIVTALHILPKEVDILGKAGRITFGGDPVELSSWGAVADIAILKIKNIPSGMRPAVIAKDISLYSMVYAKLTGLQNQLKNSQLFVYFDGLPFRARIVARVLQFTTGFFGILESTGVEYLYLDHDAKPGFSGGMFVNEKGEVAGMASYVDGGYTALISPSTILRAIEANREFDKKEEENKDKNGETKKDLNTEEDDEIK